MSDVPGFPAQKCLRRSLPLRLEGGFTRSTPTHIRIVIITPVSVAMDPAFQAPQIQDVVSMLLSTARFKISQGDPSSALQAVCPSLFLLQRIDYMVDVVFYLFYRRDSFVVFYLFYMIFFLICYLLTIQISLLTSLQLVYKLGKE